MALYVPDPARPISAADLLEELGAELTARYTNAEQTLIEEVAKRTYKIIELEQLAAGTKGVGDEIIHQRFMRELATSRAQTLRDLRALAQAQVQALRAAGLAEQVMQIAAVEGEAAAAAQLGLAGRLPASTTLSGSATQAVGALTIDLHSKLEFLNARLTRYPDDAFKRIISEHSPRVLLGVETPLIAQRKAVQHFLSRGIEAFVDKANRPWRIGTYAEMATRTSVQRAFQDAGIWRMQQSGVNLVTIGVGLDACERCAAQSGKIFSTDGTIGDITLPSALDGTTVTVHVDGTVSDARAAGWGHPNDRCQLHAYLAGMPVAPAVEYDKAAEDERARQRSIEREIRSSKRDAATAGDDVTKASANRDVKEAQLKMREFISDTGRNRNNAREQLHFSDGHGPSRPNTPKSSPAGPRTGVDIRIAKGTKLGNDVRAARSSIAKVHRIPNTAPHLAVHSAKLGPGESGMYRGSQSIIQMSPQGPSPRLTFAHETGHYLDHTVLGTKTTNLETRQLTDPLTRDWLAEVRKTDAVKRLEQLRSDPSFAAVHGHIDYLLQPWELWGRSYGQYIATRSADVAMLAEVDLFRKSTEQWTSNRQWGRTDFGPVADAIDKILRSKGLLK